MFTESDIESAKNFGIKQSLCSRRRYGVIIKDNFGNRTFGANVRVSKACSPDICVRDRRSLSSTIHECVEVGAEIHAEQAALVWWHKQQDTTYQILLVGSDRNGKTLYDTQGYPCHVCALMLKYAGFNYVWIPSKLLGVVAVSISEVIEYYESGY